MLSPPPKSDRGYSGFQEELYKVYAKGIMENQIAKNTRNQMKLGVDGGFIRLRGFWAKRFRVSYLGSIPDGKVQVGTFVRILCEIPFDFAPMQVVSICA